jgi:uncharacterized protein YycO
VHADASLLGQALMLGQAFSFNPYIAGGCHCTHAGIYAGQGMVVDATPRQGVSRRRVVDYCETRRLELRRIVSPWIPRTLVEDIAHFAAAEVGQPYSRLKVVVDKIWPGQHPDRDRLYCSTFVGLMVAQATGVRLWADPQFRPFYPAVLATHPDLTRIPLQWRST